MLTSFFTGLSGLNTNSIYLSVIGSNLANLNTVAYKGESINFADLVYQNLGANGAGNTPQVGLGARVADISGNFIQGAFQTTGDPTHMAIEGDGFFIVRNPLGTFYTRAGNFSLDASGRLVTPDGSVVQGYMTRDPVTRAIISNTALQDVVLPIGQVLSPSATTQFQVRTNLDASAAVGATFTTTLNVYDSLGAAHPLSIVYTKTAAIPNTWTYSVQVDGAEIQGGTPGTPVVLRTNTITFGNNGLLATVDGAAPADVTVVMGASNWANGAAQNTFTWDLVNPDGTFNLSGFASPSTTSSTTQNGFPAGPAQTILVNAEGIIQGIMQNGQVFELAQVATGVFNNDRGLVRVGNNLFAATSGSGQVSVGEPSTGGRGPIVGGTLELSNVDIAQEFVNMIGAQRGYQANARVITTSDEITLEAINLKR
jgi:flagellar hook protein FlgE